MAGGKETPRQKMIAMMYLVLTAILALNVSKEILDAFVLVNDALSATNTNFSQKISGQYDAFDNAKLLDERKVRPNWEKANQIRIRSKEFIGYIIKLKKELMKETEGVTESEADTLQLANVDKKDDTNVPNQLMIGNSEDGSAGKSGELKKLIKDYKAFMESFILEEDKDVVKVALQTNDPKNNENNENWELYNFYNMPLAGIITNLSCIENQVKKAESDVVEYLYKKVWAEDFRFDTIAAKVIAPTSYVLLGDEYNAEVFLAAYNKTKNPSVYAGDYDYEGKKFKGTYDSIKVDAGTGQYKVKPGKEGLVQWGGEIVMTTSKGERKVYPFKSEYMVARPSATVSPTMMNVVYLGVPNPISVSCPGVADDDVSVSTDNGTIGNTSSGRNAIPQRLGLMKVNVSAKLSGESRPMGTIEFRVKQLPTPIPSVGGIKGPCINKNQLLAVQGLMAVYPEDFVYKNITPKVKSFNIVMNVGGVEWSKKSTDGTLTAEMKDMIKRAAKLGTSIIFEDVVMIGPDGIPVKTQFYVKICN